MSSGTTERPGVATRPRPARAGCAAPAQPLPLLAYVADFIAGTVQAVDPATMTAVGDPIAVGRGPVAVAVTPDGRSAFVAMGVGSLRSTMPVIDLASRTVRAGIPLGGPSTGVAFSPDGRLAYVAAGAGVVVVDTASLAVVRRYGRGWCPAGLATHPNGRRLYVADSVADVVWAVDLDSGAFRPIPVGVAPFGVAIRPDGTRLYVANTGSNDVTEVNLAGNTTWTITDGIGRGPAQLAVTPDGRRVYVGNGLSDSVSAIDTATGEVGRIATGVGAGPGGIAVTPGGRRVMVASARSGTVSLIDTATDTVVSQAGLGVQPTGLGVTPAGGRAYVTSSSGHVAVVDTAINEVVGLVRGVGEDPAGIALTDDPDPDRRRAYVACRGSDEVAAFTLGEPSRITRISGSFDAPARVVVLPGGDRAYVLNQGRPGTRRGSVTVIRTSDDAVVGRIPVGADPEGIAAARDGSRVYVVDAGDGTLRTIDTATDEVVSTRSVVGLGSAGIAVAGDSRRVYVAGGPGQGVWSVPTGTWEATLIGTGTYTSTDVAVTPDARVYVTDALTGKVTLVGAGLRPAPVRGYAGEGPATVALDRHGARAYVANAGVAGDAGEPGSLTTIDTASNSVIGDLAGELIDRPAGVAVTQVGL
jgi:YVTN family beta-propeller protein